MAALRKNAGYCSGEAERRPGPGSCDQLWRQGGAITGYHMVRGQAVGQQVFLKLEYVTKCFI